MTVQELLELQNITPCFADRVDITTVKVDTTAPSALRAEQYLSQIKNPYAFQCSGIAVNVKFRPDGKPLKQAIASYLSAQKNKN